MTAPVIQHDVDGHTFHIHDTGPRDGAAFVVLHGVGLSHRPYRRLAHHLARSGRVIVLDLPGFGSTPEPPDALSVEDYARLIGTLLHRLDVTSCVAIGHSMGGQFALELALQQPDLVSHVAMIGPVTDSRRRTALRQSLALIRDSALEPLTTNALVFADYLRCGPRWYLREVAAMLAYPTHDRITNLERPLLIIRGENDPIATDAWCRRLTALAGGGVNLAIPHQRHVVAHTAPDIVADAITAFAQHGTSSSQRRSATLTTTERDR